MDCREVREDQRLVEWIDGELQDEAVGEAVRAHVEQCAACAREVAEHRRTWEALATLDAGEKGVGRERLEEMARTALAGAAANSTEGAPILSLSRVAPKWMAAAALVVAVGIGARLVLQRPDTSDPGGLPFPSFGDDPEFVTNFEVIRDLPDLADGELLDVGDELLILQTLEGA